MGKTTVIIDEKLLKTAIEITGAKSKREVIIEGLKALIHKKNIEAFRKELGTYDLDLTIEELNNLREMK